MAAQFPTITKSIGDQWLADRCLYVADDGKTIVEESDVRQRWQIVPAGGPIHESLAEKHGFVNVDGKVSYPGCTVVEAPKGKAPATVDNDSPEQAARRAELMPMDTKPLREILAKHGKSLPAVGVSKVKIVEAILSEEFPNA